MSHTLAQIQTLVARGAVYVSDYGYDELAKDGITVSDIIDGVGNAVVVEDYPNAMRGPTVLVLQSDAAKASVHVVWAIAKGRSEPAVLETAYRPYPNRWSSDFMQRKPK